MNYYQEITLLPDAEISLSFIWQKVYHQIHIALVDNKIDDKHSAIGVGFPKYKQGKFPLGNKLRLFAKEKEQLEALNIHQWLRRLLDYVHIKSIQDVPKKPEYVCFIRKQIKGRARIRKDMHEKAILWSQKTDKTIEECLAKLKETIPRHHSELPYIHMQSEQTKQRNPDVLAYFPLFIEKIDVAQQYDGLYNCYGLGLNNKDRHKITTVPYF